MVEEGIESECAQHLDLTQNPMLNMSNTMTQNLSKQDEIHSFIGVPISCSALYMTYCKSATRLNTYPEVFAENGEAYNL